MIIYGDTFEILILCLRVCYEIMTSFPTIKFKNSEIRGRERISWHGKKYYSFLGIPYAEPPVGELRFLPPQPFKNYPKHIDATEFKNGCIQYLGSKLIIGNEDCLYLNVFIPKLPSPDTLLPVTFFIHGGSHKSFSSNVVTPLLLIEYDFIIVTFNYRLHALGFLNLGLPNCPGNVGLKDQLCALQWVKSNITFFGGDPDNITLFGMSSGASSAHMMVMSPLFKNLSNKLILCGGHALNPWNLNPSPLKLAFELGRKFGYKGNNRETLLNLFKSIPAEKLLQASRMISHENLETPCSYSFQPSIEYIKEGAFLPDSPKNLWQNVNSISIINGINENEGIYFLRNSDFIRLISHFDTLKVTIGDLTFVREEFLKNMFIEIISFYKITENDDQENFNAKLRLFTDLILKDYYTTFDFLHKSSNSYSVFNYKFTYCGENNKMKNMWRPQIKWNVEGSYHVDEYGYTLIKEDCNLPEKDEKVAHNICMLWSNFIKYGNPNGEILENIWHPSTKDMPSYLEIDENLSVKNTNINSKRAKFWKYLSSKYSL